MRTLLLGSVAVLTLAAGVPALAQDTATQPATADAATAQTAAALTAEQQAMYDGWTAENRAAYDGWPLEAKTYYWTLTPEQTEGWWVLNDEQRVRIVGMTPEQRTQAWTAINAQLAARANPAASTTGEMASSGTMTAGDMQFVKREMAQPVAANTNAEAAASGDLPICKKDQQDGCINSFEKTGKGNRPLGYWPGKPASE